jgi:hypothetical protein
MLAAGFKSKHHSKENTTMTNTELLAAMQSAGRLIVSHIGNSVPTETIVYRLPATLPALQSRRFAQVIGNELHVRKYEDPSHGWLAVPMQWLEALGIVGKISSYSYRRNSTAYLEEDDDMHEFVGAAKRAGFQIFRDCHHTDKSSPVRSYPTYHTTGFTVEPNFSEALSQSEVFRTTLEGF